MGLLLILPVRLSDVGCVMIGKAGYDFVGYCEVWSGSVMTWVESG